DQPHHEQQDHGGADQPGHQRPALLEVHTCLPLVVASAVKSTETVKETSLRVPSVGFSVGFVEDDTHAFTHPGICSSRFSQSPTMTCLKACPWNCRVPITGAPDVDGVTAPPGVTGFIVTVIEVS